MTDTREEQTVGQMVAERPSRARIFEKMGIDYCCGGKKALDVACREQGLDPNTVRVMLAAAESAGALALDSGTDWTKAPLSDLTDNIIHTHHDALREDLPRLAGLMDKVVNAHGEGKPLLHELRRVYTEFRAEMESHMGKEEQVLFPLIRRMETGAAGAGPCGGSISNPIAVMESEHESAGDALATMRTLSDDFTPPSTACNTYRALWDGLAAVESDTHIHVHKENSILFPRAIALETSVRDAPAVPPEVANAW